MFNYTFKTLQKFPRKFTENRENSRFGKKWKEVQIILERELRMLSYRDGSVVLMTAHQNWDLRNDGKLRSDARKPEHPGVVLRFDVWNKKIRRYEPMQFECDQFTEWKDNVRGIADGLEALRKVNRYGVSSSGNQDAHYEGYKTLTSHLVEDITSKAEFLATHSGLYASEILRSSKALDDAYKLSRIKLHPDKSTGSHELFIKAKDCYEALKEYAN